MTLTRVLWGCPYYRFPHCICPNVVWECVWGLPLSLSPLCTSTGQICRTIQTWKLPITKYMHNTSLLYNTYLTGKFTTVGFFSLKNIFLLNVYAKKNKRKKRKKKESEDTLQKVKFKPTIVGHKSKSCQALKFVPRLLNIITIFLSLLNWAGNLLIYNILYSYRKV